MSKWSLTKAHFTFDWPSSLPHRTTRHATIPNSRPFDNLVTTLTIRLFRRSIVSPSNHIAQNIYARPPGLETHAPDSGGMMSRLAQHALEFEERTLCAPCLHGRWAGSRETPPVGHGKAAFTICSGVGLLMSLREINIRL